MAYREKAKRVTSRSHTQFTPLMHTSCSPPPPPPPPRSWVIDREDGLRQQVNAIRLSRCLVFARWVIRATYSHSSFTHPHAYLPMHTCYSLFPFTRSTQHPHTYLFTPPPRSVVIEREDGVRRVATAARLVCSLFTPAIHTSHSHLEFTLLIHRRFVIQRGHAHTHRELIRELIWEPKGSSLAYI